jgi:HD-like signal output (HDOD) protein
MNGAPAGILEDLRTSGRLPSPGGVALKLMELTRRDDVSSAELARTLAMDPALAGRVLRVANSAASGRAAVSIGDAVVRVGFDGVRRLAMGFSLVERNGSGACQEFDYKGYWSRSLAAAVAAERFARETRAAAGDEAFTLGLLHDVGSLALATVHPREYGYVIGIAGQTPEQQRVVERETFRVCHRELTGLMLADWQIPAPLVAAAGESIRLLRRARSDSPTWSSSPSSPAGSAPRSRRWRPRCSRAWGRCSGGWTSRARTMNASCPR